jgi:hypothetical protein
MALRSKLTRYLLDLGFYPDRLELGRGIQQRRATLTVAAYIFLVAGVLSRQCIPLPTVVFNFSNVRYSVVIASILVGTALFPLFMKWFNRTAPRPTFLHAIGAFSFGFFVDLADHSVLGLWKTYIH